MAAIKFKIITWQINLKVDAEVTPHAYEVMVFFSYRWALRPQTDSTIWEVKLHVSTCSFCVDMMKQPMAFPGSIKNSSRKRPTRLLMMSKGTSSVLGIPSSVLGIPSARSPSSQTRSSFPTMNNPDTRIATPSSPCAQQRTFSITWTILLRGRLPFSIFLILDKVPNMSLWPICSSPKKVCYLP